MRITKSEAEGRVVAMVQEGEMTILEPGEFDRVVAATLKSLGLTRSQLAEQARADTFSSGKAEALWWIIGDESKAARS